jgi:peptidoglycan-N-acetylglucosamine deacetylase
MLSLIATALLSLSHSYWLNDTSGVPLPSKEDGSGSGVNVASLGHVKEKFQGVGRIPIVGMKGNKPNFSPTSSPNQVPPLPTRGAAPKINAAQMQKADEYWQRAKEEIYRSSDEIEAQDARERRRGEFLPKLIRGNPKLKYLALTFDDGPHPSSTLRILDILRKEKCPATFFVVGHQAERFPELIRAEMDAGHTIGNHTFSHVTLTKIPDGDVKVEYQACNDVIRGITGITPRYCRPPGGDYDKSVIDGATAMSLTTVLWTDDPADYALPDDTVLTKRTLSHLSNGGIILLHDGIEQTIEVLPQIIHSARKRGFRFVTLDDLQRFGNAPVPPTHFR